jgi:hypothetical protein
MNEFTKTGITAFQLGDKQKAARIFARVVQEDGRDEEAWYWLAACVDDLEKKRYCLQRVIKINPENMKARRRLDHLEGFSSDQRMKNDAAVIKRHPSIYRIGILAFGITIIFVGLVWVAFQHQHIRNQRNVVAVLSAAEQITQTPMAIALQVYEPTEESVVIPVSGEPLVISGDGQHQSDIFYLTPGHYQIFWQYNGHPDEDQNLQLVYAIHESNMEIIENKYTSCLRDNQALLDSAIIRQQADTIIAAEKAIDQCIQTHQDEKHLENSQYYDEIDYYSTSFSIDVHRVGKNDPFSLVNVRGIYYGWTSYEEMDGSDYYLIVDASGPWSVTFKQ